MAAFARLLAVLVAALTVAGAAAAGPPPLRPRLASGVRTISIASEAGSSARVTTAARVATIVRWFNALPRFKPRPCPLLVHEPEPVTFKFLGPRNAVTTAVDQNPGTCDGAITYGNDGQVRYPTLADDHFVARVSRLLGVDLEARPTTAGNRRAARRDAASLLGRAVLPAGATRTAAHRWEVPLSLAETIAYEKAHPPRGSRLTAEGTGSGPGIAPNEQLTFSFPPLHGRLSSRELDVWLTEMQDESTSLRLSSHDVAFVVRPPAEAVPAGVTRIEIGEPADRSLRLVTKPAEVATIVRWFDALPVVQSLGALYGCPNMGADPPTVTFGFLDARGKALATASLLNAYRGVSGVCNPIRFGIGGQAQRPLLGGRFLIRVNRLLR